MRTDTRQRILAYIKEKNGVKVKEIINFIGISPQAVFRQLKKLLAEKKIVKIGTPPKVVYSLLLQTDMLYYPYMKVLNWVADLKPIEPPQEYHCASSDVWQGRFARLVPTLIRKNFDIGAASLVGGAIGEIGDNCFAHNAPSWIDARGCWFEWEIEESILHCVVADRGRGIFASLKRVRPSLNSDSEAMLAALTERITGRAPEARGNGLKFTMGVLSRLLNGSFVLQSGNARFESNLPLDPRRIKELIVESATTIRGTYAEFNINLPYAN